MSRRIRRLISRDGAVGQTMSCKVDESSTEEILKKNYYYLTRYIRPEEFYAWLRDQNVFTQGDQEEVEGKYIQSVMKASHLLDIILKKGKNGLKAFMEVLEFSYPEQYEHITGKQPREPSATTGIFPPPHNRSKQSMKINRRKDSSSCRPNTPSMDATILMGESMNKLLLSVNNKRLQVQDLEDFIRTLKDQLAKEDIEKLAMNEELQLTRDELQDARETIGYLTSDKDEISEQLKDIKVDRAQLQADLDSLKAKRDDLLAEYTELKKKFDNMGSEVFNLQGEVHLERQKTVAHRPKKTDDYEKKIKDLEKQVDKYKSQARRGELGPDAGDWPEVELSKLRAELTLREQQIDSLKTETDVTKDKCCRIEVQYNRLKLSNDQWSVTVDQMKEENNKVSLRCQEIEKKLMETTQVKERLENESKEFRELFRGLEERNRMLNQELDEQIRYPMPRPRGVPVKKRDQKTGGPIKKSASAVSANVFSGFNFAASEEDDCFTCSSLDSSTMTGRQISLPIGVRRIESQNSSSDSDVRRHCSISLSSQPLVVYPPKSIHKKFFAYLKKKDVFKFCPYVTIPSDEELEAKIRNFEIIYHEKCTGGTGYQCLLTDTLRHDLVQFDRPLLMEPLPMYCIVRMRHVNCNPIIIFVKMSKEGITEMLEEEEFMEKKMRDQCFETISIREEDTKNEKDFAKMADSVMKDILQISTSSATLSPCDALAAIKTFTG